jgi:hypothetical protein
MPTLARERTVISVRKRYKAEFIVDLLEISR